MLKTFLFDMGNVLVYFSHDRMCAQIGQACGLPAGLVRKLLIDSGLQWSYERGELTEAKFHEEWQRVCQRKVDRRALVRAASDIFWPNLDVLPVIAALRSRGHRLVLLSNTSASHFDFVRRRFSVLDEFDEFVVSYEVGALKPSEAIFSAALASIGCQPEECFYTDDMPAYVAVGRERGLQAEVFTGVGALREQLAQRDCVIP